MPKAYFSKIGNVDATEPITIKLKVTDYVFCYKGVDLDNAGLRYWFDKILYVQYEDGKRKSEELSPTIDISISASDENKKTYSFDFMINIDVETLNQMSDKPTNINEYIIEGETFFWNASNNSDNPKCMEVYLEESIYHFTPGFFVQKIEEKKFAFKIQYQELFIWFHIDFNENN